jgi:lysyl-tRNA synthetase class 1
MNDNNEQIQTQRSASFSNSLINFEEENKKAKDFLNSVLQNHDQIIQVLTAYETHQVALDEIERAKDLLNNLEENKNFFIEKVNSIAVFLPRNQPLYAFCCFAIVPSLMSHDVFVRPPLITKFLFFSLMEVLRINQYFPNIHISFGKREEFVKQRSRLIIVDDVLQPITNAVIFTGTMENANKLRKCFDTQTLFIANGAGHNPFVIAKDADLKKAVKSVITAQLYNQGQDCASPSAILIEKSRIQEFLDELKSSLKKVKIGSYKDPDVSVGPISERKDLERIQKLLVANAEWLDPDTPGIIHSKSAIVEPTIIVKPLTDGGNFQEQFAPIFFVQEYEGDDALNFYFEAPQYRQNAMYVTIFGTSKYVDALKSKKIHGYKLHDETTIIKNMDLHAPGVERGVNPFGGFGQGASCFSIHGKIYSQPTLPQREIFEQLILPRLKKEVF